MFGDTRPSSRASAEVKLEDGDFRITTAWRLELGRGVEPNSAAVGGFKAGLRRAARVQMGWSAALPWLFTWRFQPNSVPVGEAQDKDKGGLGRAGLQVAVEQVRDHDHGKCCARPVLWRPETLVQLARSAPEGLQFPEGEIVDWPDVQYREIFWDEQFHLDHLDVIKQAIRRAAFFKVNAYHAASD